MVHVQIEGEGLSFEAETSFIRAGQIIALIKSEDGTPMPGLNIQEPNNTNSRSINGYTIPNEPLPTFSELVERTHAKFNSQKITLAGYLATLRSNEDFFTDKEIRAELSRAGQGVPTNFARDLGVALDSKYIFKITGKKNSYSLTEKGTQYLSIGFPVERSLARPNSSKNGAPKKLTLSEGVENLNIIPTLEGYPAYFETHTKSNRILWLLAFAQKNNISGLTANDIDYLASRLRDKISNKALSALTESATRRGYLTKQGAKYVLLHFGDEYLTKQVSKRTTGGQNGKVDSSN